VSTTDSSQVTVRRARHDDIAALAPALASELSMEQLRERWRQDQDGYRQMLVAEVEGQVIGTISTAGTRNQRPNSLRMFALEVGETFRRRGIGTALIQAMEDQARQQGLQSVHLEVAVKNHDAIRLYERLGLQRQGEPFVDHWWRLSDDGSSEEVGELSWWMVKRL